MEDLSIMYAVVRTGGKQLRVSPGDVVNVELLPVEAGSIVELTEVLLVSSDQGTTVGTPVVPNAAVVCTSLGDGKAKKIIVHKHKRRSGYARKAGHRQPFTQLSIKEIRVG
jgi:large subunit ribosomal protein L21